MAVKLAEDKKENEIDFSKARSLVEFSKMEISDSDTLLGKRWLCRGGMAFLVAPSGIGKSVWSIQAAILWACGIAAFDIETPHLVGLKILIIQAEDDEGDVIEMAGVVDNLGLTGAQKRLVDDNTVCVQVNSVSGPDFHPVLEHLISQWTPDLVILNPLNAYLGDDDKDQKPV